MALTNNQEEDISGQVVGPYASGSSVAFSCISGGGKPAPSVSWSFGGEDLEGKTTVDENRINEFLCISKSLKIKNIGNDFGIVEKNQTKTNFC